jgi:hypothetical protein
MPVAAGVQIEYSGAFQVPAQAAPFGATSRIPELLEAKVNVGDIEPFVAFSAEALSCTIVPTCMEKLGLGTRVIFAGKGDGPAGLWPPHAGNSNNDDKHRATATNAKEPKRNLPMQPFVAARRYPRANRSLEWKTRSVVAEDGFSKLSRSVRSLRQSLAALAA